MFKNVMGGAIASRSPLLSVRAFPSYLCEASSRTQVLYGLMRNRAQRSAPPQEFLPADNTCDGVSAIEAAALPGRTNEETFK